MSLEKQVREVLGEAAVQYKKLDQLVRQGMMSPAALPILHRGLDKMQAGQVLNPQEREAVNKVLQSMLYIVTGDDTVFQKARQHTQKTRYQTEEYADGEMTKGTLKQAADAAKELDKMIKDMQDLPEWVQAKITKAADYLDSARDYMKDNDEPDDDDEEAPVGEDTVSEEVELLDEGDYAVVSSNGPFIGKKSKIHGYVKSMPKGKNLDKILNKHGADTVIHKDKMKSTMLNKPQGYKEDAAVEEGAMSRIDYQQKSGEKGSGLETFKKKPAEKKKFPANTSATQGKRMGGTAKMYGEEAVEETEVEENVTSTVKKPVKNTMIANPKTQKVRKVTPSRAKMAVKKGFVYAEEWTDEELDSLFEMDYKAKFAAMLKKTGKSLESMSDEEKKKFFNSVDAAHQAKNEEVNEGSYPDSEEMRAKTQRKLSRMSKMTAKKEKETDPGYKEETEIEEASAYADARRAMRADSKGMATTKKDGGTKTYKGAKPGEERHGGHIVMQLRKAVSIGKPVKFKDGKEHKVSRADAHKFLSKYNTQKPADREKMHSAHNSHDDFQSHINK